MRALPASHLKGSARLQVHPRPRDGTKLRKLYDLFAASKGKAIPFKCAGYQRQVADLVDYYGLDIRRVRNGTWILAGEWFGRVYVDYIADRLAKHDCEAAE